MRKLIIFDLDGCIADTEPVVRKIILEFAPKYMKNQIDIEKVFKNEGMLPLIQKSGISYWRIPFLVRRLRKEIGKHFSNVKPFPGMIELIEELSEEHTLGIATSNSKRNVKSFLRRYKITRKFKFIQTNISIFTKSWWLQILIKRHRFRKRNAIMIGDEVRDIEAAKKVKIKSIAVTWGMNLKELLKKSNPTYMAETPKEISNIIQNLRH